MCDIYIQRRISCALFSRTTALVSSVDKIGVILSEHIAYAFTETVSPAVSTTQSKRNNNNEW
jgi:hypothetical protein